MNPIDIDALQQQTESMIRVILACESSDTPIAQAFSSDSDSAKEQAEVLTRNPQLKDAICAALKSFTGDVYELSKGVVPVVVTFCVANPEFLPITPLLIAWITIMLFRATIASFCRSTEI